MSSRVGQPWRRWYKTADWQRLRIETFIADEFRCRMCGRVEAASARLACDHIVPHRGRKDLFFDPSNLQTLCKACHDTAKRREERESAHQIGVWN